MGSFYVTEATLKLVMILFVSAPELGLQAHTIHLDTYPNWYVSALLWVNYYYYLYLPEKGGNT